MAGQEVELNIDSYPAADFGGVDGIISFISANSRKINDRDNNLFYEVKVTLNNQLIELNSGKNLPLKPGMSLSANIKLRRLSYYNYYLICSQINLDQFNNFKFGKLIINFLKLLKPIIRYYIFNHISL